MGKTLVNDELWELIQPLLPRPKPRRQRFPGRKPLSDRPSAEGGFGRGFMNFCYPNCQQPAGLIGPELWWIVGPSGRLVVGKKTGPNPTDRRKPGSKHHLITDARGIPLAAILTGANRHDVTQLLPLVAAIPTVGGPSAEGGPAPP